MEERLEQLEQDISLAADSSHDWYIWLTAVRRVFSNIARASGEPFLYLSGPRIMRRFVTPSAQISGSVLLI